ncbi:MAG: DUF1446 domain-containing protein [Betaproteobacteria bacterium]|nr:DUF1446 domain-containing protein [Betaproteobacteria bacterium]
MKQKVRLGSGSGFWGDGMDPAMEVLEKGNLDYLCFDFLAELSMALLQRQKLKNPQAGYVPDAIHYMKAMMPMAREVGTKLISNGGGVNPRAAAERIVGDARALGLERTKVGLIEGDDILSKIEEMLQAGVTFANMETGDTTFSAVKDRIVSANAYTDSTGIIEALRGGCDIVIAGRVSDNAVYVGPVMHEFGWRHDSQHVDKIAAAIAVGHIVECAAGCTGGMSSRFAEMPHMGRVGFPIVDFFADGSADISKVPGSGGRVDQFTVKEHLVYEISDPRSYLMPDGIADFTSLKLEEVGADRVHISEVRGRAAPDTLKVVIGYQDGWIGESIAFFPWPHAYERTLKAKETMLERFERLKLNADQIHFDFIGLNTLHGPGAPMPDVDALAELNEVGLRCAVKTKTAEEAEKVRRAGAHLWIMGPGGTSFGTPIKPRPVVALWPTLIPREFVHQKVAILEA